MGHVYYHHPGDRQFSMDFVHPDPTRIVSRIVDYEDDVAAKVCEYDIDSEFYVVLHVSRGWACSERHRFQSRRSAR